MDHIVPFDRENHRRTASEIFPTLAPPEDFGRSYQLQTPTNEKTTLSNALLVLRKIGSWLI
jgi:hypothetical protein